MLRLKYKKTNKHQEEKEQGEERAPLRIHSKRCKIRKYNSNHKTLNNHTLEASKNRRLVTHNLMFVEIYQSKISNLIDNHTHTHKINK